MPLFFALVQCSTMLCVNSLRETVGELVQSTAKDCNNKVRTMSRASVFIFRNPRAMSDSQSQPVETQENDADIDVDVEMSVEAEPASPSSNTPVPGIPTDTQANSNTGKPPPPKQRSKKDPASEIAAVREEGKSLLPFSRVQKIIKADKVSLVLFNSQGLTFATGYTNNGTRSHASHFTCDRRIHQTAM